MREFMGYHGSCTGRQNARQRSTAATAHSKFSPTSAGKYAVAAQVAYKAERVVRFTEALASIDSDGLGVLCSGLTAKREIFGIKSGIPESKRETEEMVGKRLKSFLFLFLGALHRLPTEFGFSPVNPNRSGKAKKQRRFPSPFHPYSTFPFFALA